MVDTRVEQRHGRLEVVDLVVTSLELPLLDVLVLLGLARLPLRQERGWACVPRRGDLTGGAQP